LIKEIIPFESHHVDLMDLRKIDAASIGCVSEYEEILRNFQTSRYSFTGVKDGEIVAVGGMMPMWEGVGEGWAITSTLIHKEIFWFHRFVVRDIVGKMKERKIHRLQATVHQDNTISMKWLKRMNFIEEGCLHKYSPDGADYYMYARIR